MKKNMSDWLVLKKCKYNFLGMCHFCDLDCMKDFLLICQNWEQNIIVSEEYNNLINFNRKYNTTMDIKNFECERSL